MQEVPAPEKQMDWSKNGRNELLFAQVIDAGVPAFLTNRANIKPDKDGKGGVAYDRKALWENKILPPLKKAEEFNGATWPDTQGVFNFVDRVLSANKHLYTEGMEQAEPAEAGTEGTKDESLTSWQQVHACLAPTLSALFSP